MPIALHRRHQHGRAGRRRLRHRHEHARHGAVHRQRSRPRSCSRRSRRARSWRCGASPTTTRNSSARRSAPAAASRPWPRAWSPACSSRPCCASWPEGQGYHDFDKLPIPFRAVATDLVTGKAVVFKEGELANVMRASMSVPGAVAPAEFDGMILVDGMLTSNLPVEVGARDGRRRHHRGQRRHAAAQARGAELRSSAWPARCSAS